MRPSPPPPAEPLTIEPSGVGSSDLETITRGFALALSDPAVSGRLRDALRDSPFNEHKLLLQDFARTDTGQLLIGAAASELNQPVSELERLIKGLPLLDLYLPVRAHRTTWAGTSGLLVASVLSSPPSLMAYDALGEPVVLDPDRAPEDPVLVMHPAEPRGRRAEVITPAGPVVQDPRESDLTERHSEARGSLQPQQECYEDCSGGGGGGSAPLRLTVLYFTMTWDYDKWPLGDMEIEIYYYDTSLNKVKTVRREGVQIFDSEPVNEGVFSTDSLHDSLLMQETDGWPDGDDHIGWAVINTFGTTHVFDDDDGGHQAANVEHSFP